MRKRLSGVSFFVPIGVAIIILIVNFFYTLPYFILGPGSASQVNSAISIPPDKEHPPTGHILFTTVSIAQAHPLDIIASQFHSDDEIDKQKKIIGDATPSQFYASNEMSMDDSKYLATEVAMKRSGFSVTERGDGAQVVELAPNSPSQGKLNPGDVITKLQGTDVHIASDITRLVSSLPPGTALSMEVRSKDNETRNVQLTTGARPDNAQQSYVGIVVQTLNPKLDTPFPVNVDLGKVGGPSAGLAITLGMIDELTPGQLTGGKDVAVTGTIEPDGTVGPVGGVKQKISAVKKFSKAKLFICPNDEVAEAKRNAGSGVKVVGVANLDQAIDALVANGGDRSGLPAQPAA